MGAVIAGSSILGFAAIFVKWAMAGGATPLVVGMYRMLFALPAAFLVAKRTGTLGSGPGRLWALFAGVAFSLDIGCWHAAMTRTSAANATLIAGGLCPVWVALFSRIARKQRYGWIGWIGQAVGLGGALLLALAKGARAGTGGGEAIAFLASLFYAAFTLALGRSRATLAAPQALFWMSASSFVLFLLATLGAGHAMIGFDGRAWFGLIGLGIIVHVAAWWINGWGLGHLDAAFGALGLQTQQVATLFLAAWLLREPLRTLGLTGGALIIGGIVLAAFSPR